MNTPRTNILHNNPHGLLIPSANHSHFTIIDGAINEVVHTRDGLRTKYLQHLPEDLKHPFITANIEQVSEQNIRVINDCIIANRNAKIRRMNRHSEIGEVLWSPVAIALYIVCIGGVFALLVEGMLK